MTEQRHFQRIGFRTEASITTREASFSCSLVDLALQGALFKSQAAIPLEVGQKADLNISLPDSDINLNFTAELIHKRGDFCGFLFLTEDVETLVHLRRLLELNIGDAEVTDKEFAHWLHRDQEP